MAGAAVVTTKDAIRWGPQSEKARTLADYLGAVGTFGAFADAFGGAGRQPVKGLSYLAGPTFGTAGGFIDAAIALKEGKGAPMGRMLASQVPVAGPSLRQLFTEQKQPAEKSERAKLIEELGLQQIAPSRQRMLKELGIGK